MRKMALVALLGGAAALAGCAAVAADPTLAAGSVCGTYGFVDVDNDGFVSGDEWNSYRTGTYSFWDINGDGRISQSEFENCWRAGGFYRGAGYNPDYWNSYWGAFDANADGYLSADEYWSANTWTRIDANANGRIDANEWVWWGA